MFHLAGDESKASSRVRGYWIAEELKAKGHKCHLQTAAGKLDYIRLAAKITSYDIIVFQKTYSRYDLLLLRLANALGKQTILDIDDAPSRTDATATNARARAMMRLAGMVWAGSNRLLSLAQDAGGQAQLVPSGIKLANYPLRGETTEDRTVRLGWIGNGAHYADDLIELLLPVLNRVAKSKSIELKIVGACSDERLHSSFRNTVGYSCDLVDQIAWADPDAVTNATRDFDVGLYPLLPSRFNDFKCGFKALEYMARGIPVVASTSPSTVDLVNDGSDGYLVADEAAWVAALEKLVTNHTMRKDFGIKGRQKVVRKFSTKSISDQLVVLVGAEGAKRA